MLCVGIFFCFASLESCFSFLSFQARPELSSHYLSNAAGETLRGVEGRWKWRILRPVSFLGMEYKHSLVHITLFALLGGVTHAYLLLKHTELTEIKILKCSFLSALLCFIYGCMDEFHQYFVNGRNARFQDVLVDAVGFTAAVCAVNAAVWLYRRIRR